MGPKNFERCLECKVLLDRGLYYGYVSPSLLFDQTVLFSDAPKITSLSHIKISTRSFIYFLIKIMAVLYVQLNICKTTFQVLYK